MDSTELILTNPVLPPRPLADLDVSQSYLKIATHEPGKINEYSKEKKEQIAKNFESVFIHKLLEEMKNTIEDWGFGEDKASEQVKGIFWMYLAQDIADKGGFGLWKDVYEFLTKNDGSREAGTHNHTNTTTESLDENI
jgi:Rod binding domain-containing protein